MKLIQRYVVKRSFGGRTWNVVDTKTNMCIEGGFFHRGAAVMVAGDYNERSDDETFPEDTTSDV
jgi:hypothetical protein